MSNSAEITQPGPATVPSQSGPPEAPPRRRRLRWLTYTLPGAWGALIFACLSFTPSLLPRGGVAQCLLTGITAAIGYRLGVLVAAIWRAFANREVRHERPWARRAFLIAVLVLLVAFFALGQYWQHEIRDLMGVTEVDVPLIIASPFVAAITFVLLVQLGRGLRAIYRRLAALLRRWIGPQAANAVGWITVVVLAWLVVSGLLFDSLVNAMNETFSLRDTTTAEGVTQPTSALRSGGANSLVPWDTLGWQGRTFTGGKGPTSQDIQSLMGRSAKEPIRAYAGLASADDS